MNQVSQIKQYKHDNLLHFPGYVPAQNAEQNLHSAAPKTRQFDLNALAHAMATGLMIGIPAGLLWGCFLETLWISPETTSMSLINYYSFWALIGASFGIAVFGPQSLKSQQSDPELESVKLWVMGTGELPELPKVRLSRKERLARLEQRMELREHGHLAA